MTHTRDLFVHVCGNNFVLIAMAILLSPRTPTPCTSPSTSTSISSWTPTACSEVQRTGRLADFRASTGFEPNAKVFTEMSVIENFLNIKLLKNLSNHPHGFGDQQRAVKSLSLAQRKRGEILVQTSIQHGETAALGFSESNRDATEILEE